MATDVSFKFAGLDKLQAKMLKAAQLEGVQRIVKQNGQDMQIKAVRNAERFRGHYRGKKFVAPTGATKRSISVNSASVGKFKYKVAPGTDYAAYVELGTRKMSAQPFIKPAFDAQKEIFKKDMDRLMK